MRPGGAAGAPHLPPRGHEAGPAPGPTFPASPFHASGWAPTPHARGTASPLRRCTGAAPRPLAVAASHTWHRRMEAVMADVRTLGGRLIRRVAAAAAVGGAAASLLGSCSGDLGTGAPARAPRAPAAEIFPGGFETDFSGYAV